jgi:DNA-binding PadR family transcriptional regulator
MVYLVDDLERAGLVERIPDPNDRRSRLIRATPAGRERLRETEAAISVAEAELLGVLSADDQTRLRGILREIAAHVCRGKFEGGCEAAESVQGCTGAEGMAAAIGQATAARE